MRVILLSPCYFQIRFCQLIWNFPNFLKVKINRIMLTLCPVYWISYKLPLDCVKDGHFSFIQRSCQLGLSKLGIFFSGWRTPQKIRLCSTTFLPTSKSLQWLQIKRLITFHKDGQNLRILSVEWECFAFTIRRTEFYELKFRIAIILMFFVDILYIHSLVIQFHRVKEIRGPSFYNSSKTWMNEFYTLERVWMEQ